MAKHDKRTAAKLMGLAEDYCYHVQHGDTADADKLLADILKITTKLGAEVGKGVVHVGKYGDARVVKRGQKFSIEENCFGGWSRVAGYDYKTLAAAKREADRKPGSRFN